MKKTNRITILVLLGVLLISSLAGCGHTNNGENEIKLIIQLDLKEDIGLLIIHHIVDGAEGGGGMSNADKSMLKRNDVLDWSFDKQFYENAGDTVDLTVQFTVVTEYCDPNYDNVYPEELQIPMDAITFKASFGETYYINITGDMANGYQAELVEKNTK